MSGAEIYESKFSYGDHSSGGSTQLFQADEEPINGITINSQSTNHSSQPIANHSIGIRADSHRKSASWQRQPNKHNVTKEFVQKMGVKEQKAHLQVSGIGSKSKVRASGVVDLVLRIEPKFTLPCVLYVIHTITAHLPINNLPPTQGEELKGLSFAESSFDITSSTDLLLGAEVWTAVIKSDIRRHASGLTAQNTHLVRIIFGQLRATSKEQSIEELHRHTLQKFRGKVCGNNSIKRAWTECRKFQSSRAKEVLQTGEKA